MGVREVRQEGLSLLESGSCVFPGDEETVRRMGPGTEAVSWEWGKGWEYWTGWWVGLVSCHPLECWSFSVHGALEVIDDALERQNPEALLQALQDPALALRGLRRDFADWYLEQLSADREQKAQVRSCSLPLSLCYWGP